MNNNVENKASTWFESLLSPLPWNEVEVEHHEDIDEALEDARPVQIRSCAIAISKLKSLEKTQKACDRRSSRNNEANHGKAQH